MRGSVPAVSRERILIAGCGLVGGLLGVRLAAQGHEVWGIRRTGNLPSPIRPIRLDLAAPLPQTPFPASFQRVYYLASPGGPGEDAYQRTYLEGPLRLLERLASQSDPPLRFCFVSSTAVYGDRAGSWVDESSPPDPAGGAAPWLLQGEEAVLAGPVPATVVRFSGIYGPSRIRLLRRVLAGQEPCTRSGDVYTNRIHADDCAGVLEHVSFLDEPAPLYVASDHRPVLRNELVTWLALRLGAAPPAWIDRLPPGRNRGNKRCSNRRLLESGYRFEFPTFEDGYARILEEASGVFGEYIDSSN